MASIPDSNTRKHDAGAPSTWMVAPAGYSTIATVGGQPLELVVFQLLEQDQRSQLVGGQPLGLAHWYSR